MAPRSPSQVACSHTQTFHHSPAFVLIFPPLTPPTPSLLHPSDSGDGFSPRRSDVEVTIAGRNCRVLSTNATTVLCVTSAAAVMSEDSNAPLLLNVKGAATSCTAPTCEYTYSQARTPILTGVTVTEKGPAQWTLRLSGSFGDGSDFPMGGTEVWIGSASQCVPTILSASTLECVGSPPSAGEQTVSMVTSWGSALGTQQPIGERRRLAASASYHLPTLEGAAFGVTSVSPTTTSLAGGTTLTVTGTSFSTTSTVVRVCSDACEVKSASPTSITCTVPSSLHQANQRQTLTLSEVSSLEIEPHEFGYTPAPPPLAPAIPPVMPPPPSAPPLPPQPAQPPPPTLPPRALTVTTSSVFEDLRKPSNVVDGDIWTYCQTHREPDPWLSISLNDGVLIEIGTIKIYNRQDWPPYFSRFGHHQIWIGEAVGQYEAPAQLCADATAPNEAGPFYTDCGGMRGTHVTIVLPGQNRVLHLAEVEIEATFTTPSPPPAPPAPPPSSI